jgi:hypothetical protein
MYFKKHKGNVFAPGLVYVFLSLFIIDLDGFGKQ